MSTDLLPIIGVSMHLTLLVSLFCFATMMAIEIDSSSKAVFEEVHNPSQTMTSMFHKTFHQCSMDKSCRFVIKDVKNQKFYRLTDQHDFPAEKSNLIIWVKKQSDINECASSPCQNGGTCVDGVNGYTCKCVEGYGDPLCKTDINECASSPCQNGGTCVDGVNGYTCKCVEGYGDPLCKTVFSALDYTGCYIDTFTRALPYAKQLDISVGHLTVNCIQACFASNQAYAGLQNHKECFCGSSYNIYGKGDESTCSSICRDSTGMYCGGTWRNSVYKTGYSSRK
ncbi:neurogenic locus notch homolog protein 2-like isoform X3 [Rhopilema esculentum]|uniref:neurogenic locus notch homolog protein 2-like isoform X3 n=1 Tax=Rhopilema esculentum TaxID=499914 RepID=UPI0031D8A868